MRAHTHIYRESFTVIFEMSCFLWDYIKYLNIKKNQI